MRWTNFKDTISVRIYCICIYCLQRMSILNKYKHDLKETISIRSSFLHFQNYKCRFQRGETNCWWTNLLQNWNYVVYWDGHLLIWNSLSFNIADRIWQKNIFTSFNWKLVFEPVVGICQFQIVNPNWRSKYYVLQNFIDSI